MYTRSGSLQLIKDLKTSHIVVCHAALRTVTALSLTLIIWPVITCTSVCCMFHLFVWFVLFLYGWRDLCLVCLVCVLCVLFVWSAYCVSCLSGLCTVCLVCLVCVLCVLWVWSVYCVSCLSGLRTVCLVGLVCVLSVLWVWSVYCVSCLSGLRTVCLVGLVCVLCVLFVWSAYCVSCLSGLCTVCLVSGLGVVCLGCLSFLPTSYIASVLYTCISMYIHVNTCTSLYQQSCNNSHSKATHFTKSYTPLLNFNHCSLQLLCSLLK